MLVLLSPAKSLDFETPSPSSDYSLPSYLDRSEYLIGHLRQFSEGQLANLMDISLNLASLNRKRYAEWHLPFSLQNAKSAIFAFHGEVYLGLDAQSLQKEALRFAQAHLRILSGLYGSLKPLDLIQAYRLEMGIGLKTPKSVNLYQFWREVLSKNLSKEAKEQGETSIINLASQEYFKVLDPKLVEVPIITVDFKEWKDHQYQTIGVFAKKARGLMARFIIQNQILDAKAIQSFVQEHYSYNDSLSSATNYVFCRKRS